MLSYIMFKITAKNPLAKVATYFNVLKNTNVLKIDNNLTKYGNTLFANINTTWDKEAVKSNEFKTVLSSLMVHPDNYQNHGKFNSWYNFNNYIRTNKFYDTDMKWLEKCWETHRQFTLTVQKDIKNPISQEDVNMYENFMGLHHKWDGKPTLDLINLFAPAIGPFAVALTFNLIAESSETRAKLHIVPPTIETALVWQSHMLDNKCYEHDCKLVTGTKKPIPNTLYSKSDQELNLGFIDTEFLMNTKSP